MSAGPPYRGRNGAWGAADIPDRRGRVAYVTGASAGIGFEVAAALAAAGARVILGGRSAARVEAAAAAIRERHPGADLDVAVADFTDFDAVRGMADEVGACSPRIDLLVNNAGVLGRPGPVGSERIERHLAVNHLAHFLLTARLWPALLRAPGARVVTVASNAHWSADAALAPPGKMDPPRRAYARSKLANLLFAIELQRRSAAAGLAVASLAAHPGLVATGIFGAGGAGGGPARLFAGLMGHDAAAGALPILFAATSPNAAGGSYTGPASWTELRGPPAPAVLSPVAADPAAATALWAVSERLCGIAFPVLPA